MCLPWSPRLESLSSRARRLVERRPKRRSMERRSRRLPRRSWPIRCRACHGPAAQAGTASGAARRRSPPGAHIGPPDLGRVAGVDSA